MTAGIPGAGIGGLFYVLGALLAPAREILRTITRDPRPHQWALAMRQFVIAASILGGLAGTGWMAGLLAHSQAVVAIVGDSSMGSDYPILLARNLGMFTLTTLVAVLTAVEVLRLIVASPARAQRVTILMLVLSALATETAGQSAQGPTIEFGGAASGETGAGMLGSSVGVDFQTGHTGRIGLTYQQRRVTAFDDALQSQRIMARFNASPRRDLRVAASGGLWSSGIGTSGIEAHPEAAFRLRKVPSARGGSIDVRSHYQMIDVTPDLVRTPVHHAQISTAVDVPVTQRWSLRAQGRIAALSRATETNRRRSVGGGLAVAVSPWVKMSGQWHHLRHSNPFVTGYFAPRAAESLEAGLEIEREFDRATMSLDLGGGAQRVQRAGAVTGPWAPAFRGWGMIAWRLAPRHQLLLEFEAYDSQIANAVTSAEHHWRYAGVTSSIRILLGH